MFILFGQTDVCCFLFTDLLLITKLLTRRSDKVRVIKPPMRLDKLIVHSLRDPCTYINNGPCVVFFAQSVYLEVIITRLFYIGPHIKPERR